MGKVSGYEKSSKGASDKYVRGMSKEDIYAKVDGLKTESAKIKYLKSLENKESIMRPSTRKAFFEVIGELYETGNVPIHGSEEDNMECSAEYYKKMGDVNRARDVLIKVGDKYMKKGKPDFAVMYYEKANDKKKLHNALVEKGNKEYVKGDFFGAALTYNRAKEFEKEDESWVSQANKNLIKEDVVRMSDCIFMIRNPELKKKMLIKAEKVARKGGLSDWANLFAEYIKGKPMHSGPLTRSITGSYYNKK